MNTNRSRTGTRRLSCLRVGLYAAVVGWSLAAPAAALASCHATSAPPPQPEYQQGGLNMQIGGIPPAGDGGAYPSPPGGTTISIGGHHDIGIDTTTPSTGGTMITIGGGNVPVGASSEDSVAEILLEQMRQREAASSVLHERWKQQRAQQGR